MQRHYPSRPSLIRAKRFPGTGSARVTFIFEHDAPPQTEAEEDAVERRILKALKVVRRGLVSPRARLPTTPTFTLRPWRHPNGLQQGFQVSTVMLDVTEKIVALGAGQ